MYDVHEEYKVNKEFKKYVDVYAKVHNMIPESALTHAIVYVVGNEHYNKRTCNNNCSWKQNMMNRFTEVR